MSNKPPENLLPGNLDDYVRPITRSEWPSATTKMSAEMKALLIQAMHKEGQTLSISEWIRHVLAARIAQTLDISVTQVLREQPDVHGMGRRGTRWARVD